TAPRCCRRRGPACRYPRRRRRKRARRAVRPAHGCRPPRRPIPYSAWTATGIGCRRARIDDRQRRSRGSCVSFVCVVGSARSARKVLPRSDANTSAVYSRGGATLAGLSAALTAPFGNHAVLGGEPKQFRVGLQRKLAHCRAFLRAHGL